MSVQELSAVHLKGALGFTRQGVETPLAIPGDGILVLSFDSGASVSLASGTLRGIRFVDASGNAVAPDDTSTAWVKVVRAAPGQTVTVIHNDTGNVDTTTERIVTSSGKDMTLSPVNVQMFFAYVAALEEFRWYVPDEHAFTPTTAGDWDPQPDHFGDAFDQLGARAPLVLTGSVAVTAATPEVVHTLTLAEGEVIGVRATVTGGMYSAPNTLRSYGQIEFGASRDVGGSAAATVLSTSEEGTIPGGTWDVNATGNDVQVRVTYSVSGTLTYALRLEIDRIAVPQV